MNDLKFAFRQLLKNPGFTAVAVLTLALGIGVNVAVFSMANAVLWRPPNLPEPNQLVQLGESDLLNGNQGGVSASNFRDWAEHCRSFTQVVAMRTTALNLGGVGNPERLVGAEISEDFFSVLRVRPQLGRCLTKEDFASGEHNLALISHRLWTTRFGAGTNILGKAIRLNGEPYTVVGVVPESLETLQENVDLWTPLWITQEQLLNRENQSYTLYARLRPRVSLQQARAEMKAIAGRLAADFPSLYSRLEIWIAPLGERFEDARPFFLFLLTVTGAILVIGCANLASLLLVRSVHRKTEICVRSALGADRVRVIRQLLMESLVLSALGGGFGLLFARWGFDLCKFALPPGLAAHLPTVMQFHLDWRVLGFALLVCISAAFLFGLVPAIQSSKVNLSSGLQAGGRDLTGGFQARRLSVIFVATQIAVCFATVLFTAICFKSLRQLAQIEPGFDSQNLLTFEMTLAGPGFVSLEQRSSFLGQLVERTKALPGVRSVSSADTLPFAGLAWRRVFAAGAASKGHKELVSYAAEVSPDYFETLRVRMLRGRGFTRQDNLGSPPVAVVSDWLAQRLFGKGKNPIGERISLHGEPREIEIVGVVPNVQQAFISTIRSRTMNLYLSQQQFCGQRAMVAIRTEKDPLNLATSIRKIVAEINPDLPLFAVRTMDELIALDQQYFRYLIWCMAVFSIVAGVLAVLGIYGTVAYTVAQRTREFGVRLALGATAPRLLSLVILQAMKPVGAGLILGVFASAWLVRPLINSIFRNVADAEPWMFLSVGLSLAVATGAACVIPAIKAAQTNPVEALRYE